MTAGRTFGSLQLLRPLDRASKRPKGIALLVGDSRRASYGRIPYLKLFCPAAIAWMRGKN